MKTKNENPSINYIRDFVVQVSKKNKKVCGDYYTCYKSNESTIFVLCDGMGSGIKANISAIMIGTRIMGLLKSGMSLYDTCKSVVDTLHQARVENVPYSAFCIAKILPDGQFTVMSYEIPPPVVVEDTVVYTPAQRFFTIGYEVIAESIGRIKKGNSLILVTDGVTQAGLGLNHSLGWGMEGYISYLSKKLKSGADIETAAKDLVEETAKISGNIYMDDTTVAVLKCDNANILNIMTGPPSSRQYDYRYVKEFLKNKGKKVICGSSTAEMFSRVTGRAVTMKGKEISMARPPEYKIDGIDLVTEGAMTLSQLYNILGVNPESFDEESSVTELCRMLIEADVVNIFFGKAKNKAHKSIVFTQMGILSRAKVVSLITEKLQSMGKLVVVKSM